MLARRGAVLATFFLMVGAAGARALGGCAEPATASEAFDEGGTPTKSEAGPLDSDVIDAATPMDAPSCSETICMKQLSAGGGFACALGDDAVVRCWGDNQSGQTGGPDAVPTQVPRAVGGLGAVKQITTGTAHACALQVDGKVFCWGDDKDGLVSGTPDLTPKPTPQEIPGLLKPVVQLVAVSNHQCAVLEGGDLFCWGSNVYGQVGVRNPDGGPKSVPRPSRTLVTVVAVGGSDQSTCALRTSGEVSCLGRNSSGQLGNGTPSDLNEHTFPVAVKGLLSPIAQVANSMGTHNIVALADGRVQGWGSNARYPVVPTPGVFALSTATQVPGILAAAEVAGGFYFSCARTKGGSVLCWGDNTSGQMGTEGDGGPNTDPPKEVPGIENAERVVAGRTGFACAIVSGAVFCWGNNDRSQLGRGSVGGKFPTPAKVQL